MKKRCIALLICMMVVVSIVGCAKQNTEVDNGKQSEVVSETTEQNGGDAETVLVFPNQELARAKEFSLMPDEYLCDWDTPVTAKEMSEFFGNVVEIKAPEKLEEWQNLTKNATDEVIAKQECVLAVYYAAFLIEEIPLQNMQGGDFWVKDWDAFWSEEVNDWEYRYQAFDYNYVEKRGSWPYMDSSAAFEGRTEPTSYDYAPISATFLALNRGSYFSKQPIFMLNEEETTLGLQEIVTRENMAQIIVRFYDSFDKEPEYVQIEDIGESSITAEQIAQAPDMPEVTTQKLPSEWHGVNDISKLSSITGGMHLFGDFHEADYRFMGENGINFSRLLFSFATLEGPDYPEDGGLVNLNEIKELDEVISWGLENGVHIQISFAGVPGRGLGAWNWEQGCAYECYMNEDNYPTEEEWELIRRYWTALAERYKDIPNEYLTFDLMNEFNESNTEQFLTDWKNVIESIREVDPNRVLVASTDAQSMLDTYAGLAEMGVCIAYHNYEPRGFDFFSENPETYEGEVPTWPYTDSEGKTWTAEDIYEQHIKPFQKMAEENNVGFMINEMGIFNGSNGLPHQEEDCIEYLTELTTLLQEKGIGYANFQFSGPGNIIWYSKDFLSRDGETTEKITYEMDGYDYSFYVDWDFVNAMQF